MAHLVGNHEMHQWQVKNLVRDKYLRQVIHVSDVIHVIHVIWT